MGRELPLQYSVWMTQALRLAQGVCCRRTRRAGAALAPGCAAARAPGSTSELCAMICTAAFAAREDHDAHQARAFGRHGRRRFRPARRPTGMGPNLSDAPGEDDCATACGLRA